MREAHGHGNDRRVIVINLDVVPAEDNKIDEPEPDSELESTDEDYHPNDDADDDNELLKSLVDPAAEVEYESSDDEDEEEEAPRRSSRARRNVVCINPTMSGRSYNDVQAMQAKLDEQLLTTHLAAR